MKMRDIFGQATARWIRYNDYECVQDRNGEWYVVPTAKSISGVYNPLENAETMIVDALNIGLRCMSRNPDENRIAAEICVFAERYGLLGFMTALPTTPEFMNYETVYLPKNRFIRDESITADKYANIFFPFQDDKLYKDVKPKKHYMADDGSIKVSLAARDKPKAVEMSFQRGYAEPYDWLKTQFKDWAFMFCASFMYYEETDPMMADLHRQAISVFDGNVPTYHIELFDKPTLVWDFHSLLLMIQMIFGLMLTDESRPLRSCKHCNRAFIATHPKAEFCGYNCKNKYNVYKNREKKN
jgi:hypothetical protein